MYRKTQKHTQFNLFRYTYVKSIYKLKHTLHGTSDVSQHVGTLAYANTDIYWC